MTAFVTGATGFLGGAFLSHLLETSEDSSVVCLVRADDQDAAEERLRRSVARFGVVNVPWNRVQVICGDVTSTDWHSEPVLDLVTHVVHLAANTSFGNQAGIRKTNVEGALSVAQAMQGRPLVRYIHTGTATVCGAEPDHIVHEDDYPSDSAVHLVPYTRSKAEAEVELGARYGDMPIVVARPSIVVGHTMAGCAPSGSIFWVLRAVEALRFIAWNPQNRVDVVPVDWVADSLYRLMMAPELPYKRYHISAGAESAVRWSELAAGCARIYGGPSQNRYQHGEVRDLTRDRIREAIGECQPRHLMYALDLYARFCSLDLVFDNQRLRALGVPPAPRFTDYMRVCLESSPQSIYDQMRADFESSTKASAPAPEGVPA